MQHYSDLILLNRLVRETDDLIELWLYSYQSNHENYYCHDLKNAKYYKYSEKTSWYKSRLVWLFCLFTGLNTEQDSRQRCNKNIQYVNSKLYFT